MSIMSLQEQRRKTIPGPKNPLDKCTVVSIYPRAIREIKPTIQPGVFELAAGSYDKPTLLTVGSSSWWMEVDYEQPLLEIPNNSVQVADSIVKDYCGPMLGVTLGKAQPGIFYIDGAVDLVNLKVKYQNKLDNARDMQK